MDLNTLDEGGLAGTALALEDAHTAPKVLSGLQPKHSKYLSLIVNIIFSFLAFPEEYGGELREVKGFNVCCTPLTQAQHLIWELLLPQVILRRIL